MSQNAYFIGEIRKSEDCFIIAPKRGYNSFNKRDNLNGFYFNPNEKKAILYYNDESSVMSLLKNPKPIIEGGKQKDLFELLRQYGKIESNESYIPATQFKKNRLFYLCMNCFSPNYVQIDSNDLGIILEYYHKTMNNQKNEPCAFNVKIKTCLKKDSLDKWAI